MHDEPSNVVGLPGDPPPRIGSYRLISQLGSGGMSNVYRAVHVETGHEVAVKVLPRSLARNATMLQRFLREAKSAESLQDDNIVPIYDWGSEGGRYYIVLEYLPGGDLSDRVREYGPMPLHEAVSVVRTVARALMHAAEQGLIHRDIKPANILLTHDNQVKLTDLGLAMQVVPDDERVTRDGTTVGTVDYMSPEQARDSRATTIRSDIYSLGCTFYFLITGQPPFTGGDVPEKLRRHAYDPPPDPRALRPDCPEELALLIQRMMAKKPERRFVDYEHFIEALDELPIAPPDQVLDAIVDDEDEPPTTRPAIPPPRPNRKPPPPSGQDPAWPDDLLRPAPATEEWPRLSSDRPLQDIFGDSSASNPTRATSRPSGPSPDDSDAFQLGFDVLPLGGESPASTQSSPTYGATGKPSDWPSWPRPSKSELTEPPRDVNLAGLAEIESTGERIQRPRPPVPLESPATAASQSDAQPLSPAYHAPPIDSAEASGVPLVPKAVVEEILQPEIEEEAPPFITLTAALKSALVVIALCFAGMGINYGLNLWSNRERDAKSATADAGNDASSAKPIPDREPVVVAKDRAPARPGPWVEPIPPVSEPAPQPAYDDVTLRDLNLAGVVESSQPPILNPIVTVQRGAAPNNNFSLDSLRKALDQLSGTIEINDDGPFFEQDLRINGSPRVIRAGHGHRVMVVSEKPTLQSIKSRPAPIVLDGKRAIIEGVDFVIRAEDIAPQQTSVILCLGSELSLRDCSITLIGPIERPLALVQLGAVGQGDARSSGASSLRLERTVIRAPGATALRVVDDDARVEIVESIVFTGGAPALSFAGAASANRSLSIVSSAIASAAAPLEMAGSAAGVNAKPLDLRALGTTFAHIDSPQLAPLVAIREPAGGKPHPKGAVSWQGRGNRYVGWPSDTVAEPINAPQIENPLALNAIQPNAEPDSNVTPTPWPSKLNEWSNPAEFSALDPELQPLSARVASPPANLREWTVAAFEPSPTLPLPAGFAPNARILEFDADSPEGGDLGLFLKRHATGEVAHVRVRARGTGRKWITPIRMAQGVTLEIEVVSPAPDAPLLFVAAERSTGDALITTNGGDLILRNARFERDARGEIPHVLRVEHGRLFMDRCWLRAPMQVDPGGGDLVVFQTEGTRPVEGPQAEIPVCRLTNCLLMTGGVALAVDAGRALVQLDNCAIASGPAAIDLIPQNVSPTRFQAELSLDRCTLVGSQALIRCGPWQGAVAPDRPWLINSLNCIFIDPFERGGAPSTAVMLEADPTALTRRALLWQSNSDILGTARLVTTRAGDTRPASFPDVARGWQAFWGASHVYDARAARGIVQPARGRVAFAKFKPEDFLIAPTAQQPNAPGLEAGADLRRIGVAIP